MLKICCVAAASLRFCQDLLRSLDICLLCPMRIKCCQGQSKITQSLKITLCASAQISLRRLCFSSICVDLMSARQSGLVRRSAAKNKHFLSMGFGGDLVATLVDRRVARSSDAAKNLAWIGFLLRRVCVADERQGYLHQKRLPQFSIF